MFGSKLRSWMEAVRPRKKQHRKEKQNKNNLNPCNAVSSTSWQNGDSCRSSQDDLLDNTARKITNGGLTDPSQPNQASTTRYSANNLSSPESAYSTGYSTDGTSPGAPPDYYINIRTGVKYFPTEGDRYNHEQLKYVQHRVPNGTDLAPKPKPGPPAALSTPVSVLKNGRRPPHMQTQEVEKVLVAQPRAAPAFQCSSGVGSARLTEVVASPVLTSPRQRNRIRTNPWVPGSTLSPGQIRQELPKITTAAPATDSPVSRRFLSPSAVRGPSVRQRSLSSSSCSSLSGASVHWDAKKPSASDEDDCTLNEMMGKYDESYVYEKENDILSDSDPTDCDTDIDTGQDGGDEDEPVEGEFDFIDNGSYLELDPREDRNTGHCTYYNFDVQRKASRRRTTRRSKQCSEKRRRSSSNKKRHKVFERSATVQVSNGSKSAGATPLSVRRTKHHPTSKLAQNDCLKKRSNSISFSREDSLSTIDKRDKEADQKYRELIVEAEHILRSMKTNVLSPRRIPGPANKRVEILRNTECAKPELFMKNRLIEESGPPFTKIPSNNFNCPRFSPKRNHITNFMINNSPALMRREADLPASPLAKRPESPKLSRSHSRNENRRSPKYRKKSNKPKLQECPSSSSDSDAEGAGKNKDSGHATQTDSLGFGCPQSEPVRRKVYSGRGKTVAFNLNYENVCNNNSPPYSPTRFESQDYTNSAENLRQQVLLNTIANLKKSLEDQSASLKQVYRSSHNIQL